MAVNPREIAFFLDQYFPPNFADEGTCSIGLGIKNNPAHRVLGIEFIFIGGLFYGKE
jgi:hypothetical protein